MPDQKQEIEEAIERSRRFYNESFATRMLREINSRRETPLMGCDLGDAAGDPQASQPVEVGEITLRLNPGKPKDQALLRSIKSRRIKLQREDKRLKNEEKTNGYTSARRKEIKDELENLRGLQYQECGAIEPPKDPLHRRSSATDLDFDTDAPSVEEILNRATRIRYVDKPELMFGQLARMFRNSPTEFGEMVRREVAREANHHPEIRRMIKLIEWGKIEEINWRRSDLVIAEHYFQTKTIKRPLRELSAQNAVEALDELGVEISEDAFCRALGRLCLVG